MCKFKFPEDDLSFLLTEDISSKGADGIAGTNAILEKLPKEGLEKKVCLTIKPRIAFSLFHVCKKWKYTHQGWKAFLRNNNLPPIPVDPENFLDRFRPDLSRVIEVLIC